MMTRASPIADGAVSNSSINSLMSELKEKLLGFIVLRVCHTTCHTDDDKPSIANHWWSSQQLINQFINEWVKRKISWMFVASLIRQVALSILIETSPASLIKSCQEQPFEQHDRQGGTLPRNGSHLVAIGQDGDEDTHPAYDEDTHPV